jgi:predicted LPLAT superfamily acyltransferase
MMAGSETENDVGQPEWLTRKERGSIAAIRFTVWLALTIGRPVTRLLLPLPSLYFLIFSRASRHASRLYLSRVLGRRSTLLDVFRHYLTFASCVLDRVFFLSDRTEHFELRFHGEEIVEGILAEGRGCILLGAHMGSFEALRSVGRRQPNLRVKVVMYEENARKVGAVLNAINPELASEVISLGSPDSFIAVQQCLEEGGFVGVLADRSLSNERQVACSFLGAPAQFSLNPFRMIAILQKPVVFMVGLYRGGGRYDIHFERFADPGEITRWRDAGALQGIVGRYVQLLEHYCRIAPYNWFNFYDIWK